jgi:hypothetical protein
VLPLELPELVPAPDPEELAAPELEDPDFPLAAGDACPPELLDPGPVAASGNAAHSPSPVPGAALHAAAKSTSKPTWPVRSIRRAFMAISRCKKRYGYRPTAQKTYSLSVAIPVLPLAAQLSDSMGRSHLSWSSLCGPSGESLLIYSTMRARRFAVRTGLASIVTGLAIIVSAPTIEDRHPEMTIHRLANE